MSITPSTSRLWLWVKKVCCVSRWSRRVMRSLSPHWGSWFTKCSHSLLWRLLKASILTLFFLIFSFSILFFPVFVVFVFPVFLCSRMSINVSTYVTGTPHIITSTLYTTTATSISHITTFNNVTPPIMCQHIPETLYIEINHDRYLHYLNVSTNEPQSPRSLSRATAAGRWSNHLDNAGAQELAQAMP